jgi:hypothetical protein
MRVDKEQVAIMAEAFNLLMAAQMPELSGNQLEAAGAIVTRFKNLIEELAQDTDDQGAADETE